MQALSAKIDLYLPLRCILDFRDVTFMDSSGIAVVIHTLRRMNTLQGRLLLQNIPPQPYKVLRAAGHRKNHGDQGGMQPDEERKLHESGVSQPLGQ